MKFVILSLLFLALFAFAETLYRRYHIKAEYTRKIVHIGTGLLTLLFPVMLHSHWEVLILCLAFAILLIISQRTALLPSVNDIRRVSYGSLAFPLAVWSVFFISEKMEYPPSMGHASRLYFYIPLLTMTLADPAAALAGRKWPLKKFRIGAGTKSPGGSMAFFVVTFILNILLLQYFTTMTTAEVWLLAALVAMTSCMAEFFTPYGLDNLSVPVVATLMLYFGINYFSF